MWGAPHARRARLLPTCLQCLQCLLCRSHGWLHISRCCFSRPPLPLVSMFLAALHWLSSVTGAWCWVVTGSPWIPPAGLVLHLVALPSPGTYPPRSSVDEFKEVYGARWPSYSTWSTVAQCSGVCGLGGLVLDILVGPQVYILCGVIYLVGLQGKLDIGHPWEWQG